jgi:hypothetical protein
MFTAEILTHFRTLKDDHIERACTCTSNRPNLEPHVRAQRRSVGILSSIASSSSYHQSPYRNPSPLFFFVILALPDQVELRFYSVSCFMVRYCTVVWWLVVYWRGGV